MELLEKDEEHISSLLKQGKKVEAVAFVKDKIGMTLKEAKDYIDKKNIFISEEDEKYISSLINENKKLQAVAFLLKSKNMSLLEAKNYTDRLILRKDIETNKRSTCKWTYVYDEELNTFVPNLARQKKTLKIMKSVFWIFLLISLIQLIFWDRSSDIKMITFRYSISVILVLIIDLLLGSLSIQYIFEYYPNYKNFHLKQYLLFYLFLEKCKTLFSYLYYFYNFIILNIETTQKGFYELLLNTHTKYTKSDFKIANLE